LGLCDAELEARVATTLRRAGLDVEIDPWLRDDVLSRIGVDKKRTGSRLGFVTLAGVGAPDTTPLELDELLRILHR
jgi:3-dehydroquinate synthetase